MGQSIVIASGKGGTGKTTTAACICIALSNMGKKVLAIDCDFGLRNLDLALFIDDKVVFDISDVIDYGCSFEKAVISHPTYKNLLFLAAPQNENKIRFNPEKMGEFVQSIKDKVDFVILDGPASLGESFYCAIAGADKALVVTTPEPYALRDAQKIAEILEASSVSQSKLIINKLKINLMEKGYCKNIDEIIDTICLPLIGVVPYDENVTLYAARDISIMQNEKLLPTQAYLNIAKRICGKSVPLMKIKKPMFR